MSGCWSPHQNLKLIGQRQQESQKSTRLAAPSPSPDAVRHFAALVAATSVEEVESVLSMLGLHGAAEHAFKDWRTTTKVFDDWRCVLCLAHLPRICGANIGLSKLAQEDQVCVQQRWHSFVSSDARDLPLYTLSLKTGDKIIAAVDDGTDKKDETAKKDELPTVAFVVLQK